MRIRNILFIALGFVLLAVGAAGIFLPIWPTTPFVLLAASCFSVSPKIQTRLMRINFFREHVTNYKERTGLPRGNVVISLSFLWIILLISLFLTRKVWITLLLISVGIAVTVHILCIAHPKKKRERRDGQRN